MSQPTKHEVYMHTCEACGKFDTEDVFHRAAWDVPLCEACLHDPRVIATALALRGSAEVAGGR